MMGDTLKRWRWAIAVAAILLLGLAYAFWPEAVEVDTAEVTRGPMQVGITDDGVTRAEDLYVVSAPVTGYLSRVELEPGDAVVRGSVVARMSGRPTSPLDQRTRAELQGALASARAGAQGAQAGLDQARRDLARAEELSKRGFLAKAQLEATRTRVATGQAAVAQARAEAARISALLAPGGAASGEGVPVRVPADGTVLSVINESEGAIAEGTPLLTVGDPRRIEAVIDLLSRDAVQVRPGARVEITQWGGPRPLTGRVVRVEPFGRLKVSALGIEEQRVNVIVAFDDASARQAARLGHGYQVDATVVLWRREDALRVPVGALFRGPDGGWRTFRVAQNRARETRITVGKINDTYGEVLSGLAMGDRVVVNPGSSLTDGDRVVPR